MRLALILPSYSSDDSVQIPSLSLLANGLASNIDVTIFPLRNPEYLGQTGGDNPHIVDPNGAGMRFRSLVQRAIGLIRSQHRIQPFDVLHAYWLFEPGAIAILAGRLLNIPVVVSVGGAELTSIPAISYGGMRTRRGRLANRSILQSARTITGGSRYVLDQVTAAAPARRDRLRLAPLPVDTGASDTTDDDDEHGGHRANQLLQVGAYLPVKGQDLSIRAFAVLASDHPDMTLTMIGEDPIGYLRRMQDLAVHLGIGDRVRFLGRIPHAELIPMYRNAQILLMPSRHESQGMVVLEAAVQSLPTVGSNVGVVRDLAPEAAVAVLEHADFRDLARAIADLTGDNERRAKLGAAARQQSNERYGVEPVVSRWLDIYDETRRGA